MRLVNLIQKEECKDYYYRKELPMQQKNSKDMLELVNEIKNILAQGSHSSGCEILATKSTSNSQILISSKLKII